MVEVSYILAAVLSDGTSCLGTCAKSAAKNLALNNCTLVLGRDLSAELVHRDILVLNCCLKLEGNLVLKA